MTFGEKHLEGRKLSGVIRLDDFCRPGIVTLKCLCRFFLSKWPSLFMACYATGLSYLKQESDFATYFPREAQEAPLCTDIILMFLPGATMPRASLTFGASHEQLVRI